MVFDFLMTHDFSHVAHGETPHFVQIGENQKQSVGPSMRAGRSAGYSFPHCLPVKNRRVVLARNTFPARRTVEGNSGWEGLQGKKILLQRRLRGECLQFQRRHLRSI